MENLNHIRDYLKLELRARKTRNQYYSMRSFANFLDISSGALSEILNGKRNLGLNKAYEISEKLKLDEDEKRSFLNLAKKSQKRTKNITPPKSTRTNTLEIYEFISNPLYSFILASADLDEVEMTPSFLATKLGYPREEIEYALARMVELDFIEFEDGKYQISNEVYISPNDIPSLAIRNFHHSMLNKAKEALEEQEIKNRDIQGMTFAISEEKIEALKLEIRKFQKFLIDKYQSDRKNKIYHLETALFEITKQG